MTDLDEVVLLDEQTAGVLSPAWDRRRVLFGATAGLVVGMGGLAGHAAHAQSSPAAVAATVLIPLMAIVRGTSSEVSNFKKLRSILRGRFANGRRYGRGAVDKDVLKFFGRARRWPLQRLRTKLRTIRTLPERHPVRELPTEHLATSAIHLKREVGEDLLVQLGTSPASQSGASTRNLTLVSGKASAAYYVSDEWIEWLTFQDTCGREPAGHTDMFAQCKHKGCSVRVSRQRFIDMSGKMEELQVVLSGNTKEALAVHKGHAKAAKRCETWDPQTAEVETCTL